MEPEGIPSGDFGVRRVEPKHLFADLWSDLRHGARLLRLNPAFACVAILSLALGVGANTTIFQLIDSVALRSLPVNRPKELFQVRVTDMGWSPTVFLGGSTFQQMTNPLWERVRANQQAFSKMAAVGSYGINIANGGESRFAQVLWVSGDFFDVLGVKPQVGRLISAEDDHPGCAPSSVVISYGFWQREFGGDPEIAGRKFTVRDQPLTILGVTPESFFGMEPGRSYDLAFPLCAPMGLQGSEWLARRDLWFLGVIGRLKPGWTMERASAHLAALSPGLLKETAPPDYSDKEVRKYLNLRLGVTPADSGFSRLRNTYAAPLLALMAIAIVVLLVACANLANLLLARAAAREQEIAVRLAIGASRGRLIRQMIAESLLLALVGAGGGWILARVLSQFLVSSLNALGSRANTYLDLTPDWRMLAFTGGAALLTCLLFGLAPAMRGTRVAPAAALSGARSSDAGGATRERFGMRRTLVVVQVSLSLALMVCAVLFARRFTNLMNVDAGFRQEGVLHAVIDYTTAKIPVGERQAFRERLLDSLRAIPGVTAVGDTFVSPVSGNYVRFMLRVNGADDTVRSAFNWVSPGFFQTLDIPLLAGRDFDRRDTHTSPKVAVINEEFARLFFPGASPLGKTFQTVAEGDYKQEVFSVVGVVKNSKYKDIREDFLPVVFVPESQYPNPIPYQITLLHTSVTPSSVIPAINAALAKANPAISVTYDIFRERILRGMLRERLVATLSEAFGLLAAVLATVGLYGVLSYMVIRRTREIGIRAALGAEPPNILGLIMKEAVQLLAIGMALGLVLAWFLSAVADAIVYGHKPRDLASFGWAALTLAVVGLLAGFIPARRASRLSPMKALREE